MPFEGQIQYSGELVSQFTTGEGDAQVTNITIRGKIAQLIEEELVEETSAFVLEHSNGLEEQINSDRSAALFNKDGSERFFVPGEMDIKRVESAQAA